MQGPLIYHCWVKQFRKSKALDKGVTSYPRPLCIKESQLPGTITGLNDVMLMLHGTQCDELFNCAASLWLATRTLENHQAWFTVEWPPSLCSPFQLTVKASHSTAELFSSWNINTQIIVWIAKAEYPVRASNSQPQYQQEQLARSELNWILLAIGFISRGSDTGPVAGCAWHARTICPAQVEWFFFSFGN